MLFSDESQAKRLIARQDYGSAIRQLRQDVSFTQVQLAAKTGLAATSIHRYEVGASTPDSDALVALWKTAVEMRSMTAAYFAEQLGAVFPPLRPCLEHFAREQERELSKEGLQLSLDDRLILAALIKVLKYPPSKNEGAITGGLLRKVLIPLLQPWIYEARLELSDQLLKTVPARWQEDMRQTPLEGGREADDNID